ncbi:MAG: aminoacyl-tRNA hydrolase [Desulfovibrio sp.]|nr:aminoacyl-tRNA hydrolase [Desulfovibrio sp.]
MRVCGLIAGLGNPGKEYEGTRHNFGFMVLHSLLALAEKEGQAGRVAQTGEPYLLWRCSFPGCGDWLLTAPLTYMNASGEAIQRVCSYYRLTPEDLLVLHDELDLPLGHIRWKRGGGLAGHNGLKSIRRMLSSSEFHRLRLGIGKNGPGMEHVLSRFRPQEKELLDAVIAGAVEGILLYMKQGENAARAFCAAFSKSGAPA